MDTWIGSLIIYYVCGPHTHIIRDYKRVNPCVNTGLALLLYVCVAHTHEPNPCDSAVLVDSESLGDVPPNLFDALTWESGSVQCSE